MEIWESKKDLGAIMRILIIVIEIIAIILLFAAIPEKEARAVEEKEVKYFLMSATAYYPGPECTYPYDDGFTATGAIAGKGCIAIDPDAGILKIGQRVFVEDYGFGECNDVGVAIKGWKIDLCYDTLEEAKEWGRQLVKVYVLN